MNPEADNDNPGESFDFGAAEQQFEYVELPTLERELGPAERHLAHQIQNSFEVLEEGLRRTLELVEQVREIDFAEVMKDPELAESVCAFSEVAAALPHGLAPIAIATLAARSEFGALDHPDDLPEAT